MEILLLALVLAIGFLVAFAVGSNDETMSPAVGARIFTVNTAVAIGGLINIVGAVTLGTNVSERVGTDIAGGSLLTLPMVFAVLLAMAFWLLVASFTRGLPISTTQCVVGSVIGVVALAPLLDLADTGTYMVDWSVVGQIFAGWIASPIIGFAISGLVYSGVRRLQKRATGLASRERQERIAAYGLAVFLIITSLSRGGNDVANAVAPLIALPEFQGTLYIGFLAIPMGFIPLLIGGVGMALGLAVIGRRVIRTLATEVVTLSPTSALSASMATSIVMFVGTILGFPLSGTHVLVAALVAVGWVSREPVRKRQVRDIIISWIVTVPISAICAVGMLALIQPFF
ncbi:inorganic phosphate transporter [Candidatus Thorarchaeota archaeon]|nr:MAG: inorganic phosphate transporter [Candidatus Thorarchaeota archaeon]